MATNRNGGMLRLIALLHDDDDDDHMMQRRSLEEVITITWRSVPVFPSQPIRDKEERHIYIHPALQGPVRPKTILAASNATGSNNFPYFSVRNLIIIK